MGKGAGVDIEDVNRAWLATLRADAARFPASSRARGRDYAATGHVADVHLEGRSIHGQVQGTELYDVHWEWLDDGWDATCSCPVGYECKHCYAVATVILEAHAPDDAPRTRASSASARTSAPLELFTVPTSAAPQEGSRSAAHALDGVRSAASVWDGQRALTRVLQGAPRRDLAYLPVFHDALADPSPELRCWRVATLVAEYADGWLPPALEDYRTRPDLADAYMERDRTARIGTVLRWAETRAPTSERRLRVVLELTRDPLGVVRVTAEARLTTTRLSDAPRTLQQLNQLRSDAQRGSTILAPAARAVIEVLATTALDGGYYSGSKLLLSGTSLHALLLHGAHDESSVLTWGNDLPIDLAARAAITPGAPPRLAPDSVRLTLTCEARENDACLGLAFVWPDGRSRDLAHALRIASRQDYGSHHPVFVLADGMFSLVSDEPPADVVERLAHADGVRLTARDRGPVLTVLAARFPHLRATLESHTHVHRVTPAVTLDLRDDDWLQLRAFAYTGEESWHPADPASARPVFEYAPGRGWIPQSAAGATSVEAMAADSRAIEEDASSATGTSRTPLSEAPTQNADAILEDPWLELPDPATVEPLVDWLSTLPAVDGTRRGAGGHEPMHPDRDLGTWMPLSRRGIGALAEAWDRRPESVTFFGTERVRRLLQRSARVVPNLRIAASGLDWLAVSADWQAEGMTLGEEDLAALRAATTPFVRLRTGWVRKEVAAAHDEAADAFADLGIEPGGEPQRLSLWQLAGARPETLAALGRLGADAETLAAVEQLRRRIAKFAGLPRVKPSRRVTAALRPYQQRGLDFLAYAASLGLGAVLADDMGLGKTLQALAWLEHLRAQAPDGGPSLVVCPASVLHNWAREAARFVPKLRVLVLGSGATRHALRRELPAHDLALTTYALLRRDLDEWSAVDLRAVILDEAQTIKNPDAVVSRAAGALRAQHRLALTGTPLENRALDLWSIVQFVNPGYLGNRAEFSRRYDRLDAPPHARALLAAKLRPILLRRMKRDVALDLPERIEERRDCEMTRGQRRLYLAELARSRRLVERLSSAPDGMRRNKIAILAALTRLRQVCCHPALVGGRLDLGSGKFDALIELLEPLLAEGHKVLLFSQFVRCLKLLEADLARRDIPSHVLTGQTTKRDRVVDAFSTDPRACVFLISLKAGGLGLNLTSASHVVLFDPWWNPAVEAQAIDRTHRIGQNRTVIAFRLLTAGTIEDKIFELQQRKTALARDLLGEDSFARSLSREDLGYLLADE